MRLSMEDKYIIYVERRMAKIDKGYVMEEAMSFEEFCEIYELAQARGDKNIVRELVEAEQIFTQRDLKNIEKEQKELKVDFKIVTEDTVIISPTGRKMTKKKMKGYSIDGKFVDIDTSEGMNIKELYNKLVKEYEEKTGMKSPYSQLFYKESSGGVFY